MLDSVIEEAAPLGDDSLAIVVAVDDQTDNIMIIAVPVKGPDQRAALCMVQFLDTLGYPSVTLQSDREPSIVSNKKATTIDRENTNTVKLSPRESPRDSQASNGPC